jgi:hypothetical protein
MGMDVHGLNPVIRKEPTSEILEKDWTKLSEDDLGKYFEAKQKHEEENPGIYFRNNVWWWRPLWDYVYDVCPDILNDNARYDGGHGNGGTEFTDKEAKDIADKLFEEIDNGDTEAYAKLYEIKTEDDEYNYPFSVVNVREFARFCRDSGGFQIC